MNENEAELSRLYTEMGNFLRTQCRSLPQKHQPLTFRVQYKNSLKVTDSEKIAFSVDESYLNNYRTIYTDKNYRYVRLNNWEFQIQFLNKTALRIHLIASKISFLPAKGQGRDLQNCHFKVAIATQQSDIRTLSPDIQGFLNRLGKRNVISTSGNVAKQLKSLLNFAKRRQTKVQYFNFKPYSKIQGEERNPLEMINQEGKQVIQKLRHFLTPQDVHSFLNNVEISEYTEKKLKRILTEFDVDQ